MPELPLTDSSAVLRAIDECTQLGREEFARRYGFARSSRYELVHAGTSYDSAAIVAVAYRYEHGRALGSDEVRDASTVLRELGFEILDLTPPWVEEEMLLALDTYLRHRGQRLGKKHPEIVTLSDTLRALAPLRGRTKNAKYRNPAGIEQQVGKFLNLDPTTTLKGRGDPSALHRQIWERYADDALARDRRVAEILNQLDALPGWGAARRDPPVSGSGPLDPGPPRKVPRGQLLAPFAPEPPLALTQPAEPIEVDPQTHDRAKHAHESTRMRLAQYLAGLGLGVHQGRTEQKRELLFDVAAEHGDFTWIVEVKSLPVTGKDHERLRSGLGQVLWYRSRWRQRCSDPCIAVLCVERRPAHHQAWLEACSQVSVVLTWPARFSTLLTECGVHEEAHSFT